MDQVKIENAKGLWVKLVDIGKEDPAFGRITTTKDQGIVIEFTVSEHPTCGHFRWWYPRGTLLDIRPPARKGR